MSATLEKIPSFRLRLGQGGVLNTVNKALKFMARALGLVATLASAVMDWANVWKAWSEKKTGLMNAYLASAAIGTTAFGIVGYSVWMLVIHKVAVTHLTLCGMSFSIGGILFFLAFVGAIMAMVWVEGEERKDGLQEWLSRCCFGKGSRGPTYSSTLTAPLRRKIGTSFTAPSMKGVGDTEDSVVNGTAISKSHRPALMAVNGRM